jgi:excisionase family DNA binding protein
MALMSPKDAAARLVISVKTLMGHVRDGSIRFVNVGRGDRRPRYAFSDSDLAEFEAKRSRRNIGTGG